MQASKRVVKNTSILYARMLLTVFISLYTTRLTLANLGADNFGLFGLVGGVIAMLGFLSTTMSSATQRFISIAQGAGEFDKLRRIFNISLVLHWVTAFLVLLILEIAGYFFFNGTLNISEGRIEVAKLIYQFMVMSALFTIISVPYEAVITSHENMLVYAILGFIESLLKLGIAYFIVYSTYDRLLTYGFLMALLSVFLLFIKQVYCRCKYQECSVDVFQNFDKKIFRQMTSFASWSFLGSTTSLVANYGQGVVLNMFFGTTVNAAQNIANQLNGQLGAFSVNMLKALNPLINKSEGSGNRELMLKATMMGSKVSFFLVMAFHIPVLIEMPLILKLWLADVPDFTVIFCRLLLIRILIEHLFHPVVSAIVAVGNIKSYQIASSLLLLLPLPVSYFLYTAQQPAYAIYVVFIIYTIISSAIIVFYAIKHCDLSPSAFMLNVILRCSLTFILVFGASFVPHYFIDLDPIRLTSTILTSATAYLLVVFFIGFSREERSHIKKLVSSMLKKPSVIK